MSSVILSFRVHIPYRLKKISPGADHYGDYFDMTATQKMVDRLADQCYLPANEILLQQIRFCKGRFRLSFSISGTSLELLRTFRPDVLQSFRSLVNTRCVEFYAETYYNSLSWLYSPSEFERQVKKHQVLVNELFGLDPVVFRNTELIYSNELARQLKQIGYKAVLCEGLQKILAGRSPNKLYAAPGNGDFGLLLRHSSLSDDIAFRFDDPNWNEQPLTAEKFAGWLCQTSAESSLINLFLDYETFGIHKKEDTGIFQFLEQLPAAVLAYPDWHLETPSEAIDNHYPVDLYDVPKPISWEGKEKASCVWSENTMQNNTIRKIYSLENMITQSRIPGVMDCWARLQSADHFYYMCREGRDINDVYRSLNPFSSPEEAYENYRDAVADLEISLIRHGLTEIKASSFKQQRAVNLYSNIF